MGSEVRSRSSQWEELGMGIIRERFPWLQEFKIVFLVSDKQKKSRGRYILGECRKVDEKYSWCCPYDFMITIFEENCLHLTEGQRRILMEHELMHIGKDGEIVPHDIEDFIAIVEKYGLHWDAVKNPSGEDFALLD